MKTRIHIMQICLLASLAVLQACTQADEAGTEAATAVSPQFTADIDGAATRAVDQTWQGDEIGVMVTAATGSSTLPTEYRNAHYKTTDSGSSSATFEPEGDAHTIYIPESSGTVTFAAYAPYQPTTTDDAATQPGTDGVITANTIDQGTSEKQQAIDFLYAKADGSVSNSKAEVKLTFSHVMSKLVLEFKVGDASIGFDDLKGATYKLSGICHDGTFDMNPENTATFGIATADADGNATDNWDISSFACTDDETEGVRTYSLILFPQDLSASGMTISVNINGQDYSTIVYPNLKGGEKTTYTVTINQKELTATDVSGSMTWGTGDGSYTGNVEM